LLGDSKSRLDGETNNDRKVGKLHDDPKILKIIEKEGKKRTRRETLGSEGRTVVCFYTFAFH